MSGDNQAPPIVDRRRRVRRLIDESHASALRTARSGSVPDRLPEQKAEEPISRKHRILNARLFEATKRGDLKAMSRLLEQGANPNARNRAGEEPLTFAVIKKRVDAVRLLISMGASVNTKNHVEQTPLMRAAYIGESEIVKVLTGNGAHVDARDVFGQTALMNASFFGYKEIVAHLLEKGANACMETRYGQTAQDFALRGYHDGIGKTLGERARHGHRDSP
jgi:hypothetical protein